MYGSFINQVPPSAQNLNHLMKRILQLLQFLPGFINAGTIVSNNFLLMPACLKNRIDFPALP